MSPAGARPAVALAPAPPEEKAALKAMLDPYLVAHADLVDPQRVHGDPTDYPMLDLYWVEPERRPYWILAEGARVGLVLVNRFSPSGFGCEAAIAEFFVEPQQRRRGIGQAAALAAFATRPGVWELQVSRRNPQGLAFWPRAIAAAAPAEWREIMQPDRLVHRFRTA